jgi:small conductance mechanosensitive channel
MFSFILESGKKVKSGFMNTIKDFFGDIIKQYDGFSKSAIGAFVAKIVLALVIYLVGRRLVKLTRKIVKRSLDKANIEESVSKFLGSLTSILLNAVLIVIIVTTLGVPASSFITILGSAGLAIGLSLQGSLSNFAGGVLILILKPFRVNDYIVSEGIEGKVTAIDIFYTQLITPDNKKVVIPNGTLSNSSIMNVPDEDERRLDLVIPVDYNSDIKHVRGVLNSLAKSDSRVKIDKGVDILVSELADSSINISFRMWVETADYFPVRADMLERVIDRFREENINIPFNKMDVNIVQG